MKKHLFLFYIFNIIVLSCFGQPSNDDCIGAIPLTIGSTCSFSTYTNVGATATTTPSTPQAPGCGNYQGGDVWFSVVVPASGHLIFDTQTPSGGLTDVAMAIYSGTCNSLTRIECNDDGSTNGAYMAKIDRTGLTPGTTIYLRVWEYGNNEFGNFNLCVYEPIGSGPCGSITSINCGLDQSFTLSGSGIWNLNTCGISTPGKEKIYAFTPTVSGPYVINVSAASGGVSYSFKSGSCTTTGWTCIAHVSSPGNIGPINLTAGTTYYFLLDCQSSLSSTSHTFRILCKETAGNYLHPIIGIQNTYNGMCMVNTCSGTYTDDGGASGNYSNNVNGIYRTFCPDSPGKCLTATFNSMDIEGNASGCYDYLIVRDGPTQNSPIIWAGCRTNVTPYNMLGTFSSTFTSSNSSGCLTFQFASDNITNRAGWNISLNCTNCTEASQSNNDCASATAICGATNLSASSPGPGLTSTCGGCNLSENYSNWYFFEITDDGKLALDIKPENLFDDYDLALYQSDNCSNLGNPIRCSYAMAPNYCFPSSSQTCTANITRLRFNTIDNTSGGYSSGLYANYTNISTNVMKGSTYSLTVEGQKTSGGTVYLRAWFDWNKNLTFDAGELYNLGTSISDNYSISSNITIPATARLGTTAFRVFANKGSYQTNPCNTTNTGEAETYRIFIQDGTHCSNGIKDADEEGVDCGGADCVPCNASYWPTNTGMNGTATDFSEDVYGDSWINWVSVTAGQRYYLMVNNWSANAEGFDLLWNFSEGGAMDCNVLPVEMLSFEGICDNGKVNVSWEVASETNNHYFVVLKSYNGIAFAPVDTVYGRGNANSYKKYEISYLEDNPGTIYYKLKQVDFDGAFVYSPPIVANCGDESRSFSIYPNPVKQGEEWKINGLVYGDKVQIFDIYGREHNKNNLDAGMYNVVINGKLTKKLIVY